MKPDRQHMHTYRTGQKPMHRADKIIQLRDPHPDPIILEETMTAGEHRRRRIDILEQWADKGIIEQRHRAAGMQFQNDFHIAGLSDRYSCQTFDRIDTSSRDHTPSATIDAKDRVRQAMYVLGQISGSAAWDILGRGDTLQVYARNHTWTGKNLSTAKGILLGTLDALANHYRC